MTICRLILITQLFIYFQELEKETTERVKSLFDDIDRVLYADDGVGEKGNRDIYFYVQ